MRVLVATDLSEAGLLSIEALLGCNPDLFDGVTLVHVLELEEFMAGGPIQEAVEWARKRLAEEADALKNAGFRTDYRVEEGRAADVVQAVAAEIPAEIIVVTDRGKGGAPGRFLGSTTERIAQAGEVPVLVERVEERDAAWCSLGKGSPFARPLVAADLDERLQGLALAVGRLPGRERAQVVHVAAPGASIQEARGFVEAEIMRTPLHDSEVVIVEGRDPAEAIIAEAHTSGATLIALAPRRHGVLGRLVLGSVARSLLKDSRIPLLFA
ncbi:MAG: universal stress protein [Anaerosomatales bacterium]|nr:universal stress protein [Anaerosomatales bacterium]MDT8435075.1 universal stress protein [Anaerosomatales bacterium]